MQAQDRSLIVCCTVGKSSLVWCRSGSGLVTGRSLIVSCTIGTSSSASGCCRSLSSSKLLRHGMLIVYSSLSTSTVEPFESRLEMFCQGISGEGGRGTSGGRKGELRPIGDDCVGPLDEKFFRFLLFLFSL